MAQSQANREERPLQQFVLKNFLAVDTTDSRLAPLDNACFYDLANCQPIGFSNLHSVQDLSAPLHDFGPAIVYADFNINIMGVEHLLVACRDGTLWDFNVETNVTTQIGSDIDIDGSLDIAQWDWSIALIVATNGYWYWQPGSGAGGGSITLVSQWPGISATPGLPSGGQAIAVYNQMAWIALDRGLYYSKAGDFAEFSTAAGGGFTALTDPTLKSNVTALFAANGYLYLWGVTSCDAISDVYYPVDPTSGVQLTTPSYTKLNLSAIVGTDQPETIMVYGRLVLFANRQGIWKLYGTTVEKISGFDANNAYLSSIDGTWQYLDFDGEFIVARPPPAPPAHYPIKASGGQVQSNALLNAAFLVTRKGDPIFADGNFLLMWQKDQAGGKWWSVDYELPGGGLTHVCTALVKNTPALFGYINNVLYQLLADPTSAPAARIMTSLWDLGDPLTDKQALRAGIRLSVDGNPANIGVTVNLDTTRESFPVFLPPIGSITDIKWVNDTGQVVSWKSNTADPVYWTNPNPPFLSYWGRAPNAWSKYLGFTVTTQRGTLFELNGFFLDWKGGARWVE